MCGIVGAVAGRDVTGVLLEGLHRLEYRGYDSAGLAMIDAGGALRRARAVGRVEELRRMLSVSPLNGHTGVAHTRWATHGRPSEENAHPHLSRGQVALVHNGIIENHESLRENLRSEGYEFTSETDSEVIVNQIHRELAAGAEPLEAVRRTVARLDGAYALGVVCAAQPDRLVAARRGSPLLIGLGNGEGYIASDMNALVPVTSRYIAMQDGDVAEVTREGVTIIDVHGVKVDRPVHTSKLSPDAVNLGNYRHFMQKEIYEQPTAVADTLEGRLAGDRILEAALGHGAGHILDRVQAVQIIACGTSYHAGLVARYWLEAHGVPCNVEVASEFRYRAHVLTPDTLVVTISQSGETADTLAALQEARRIGFEHSLAICNVPESSLVRESELTLMTHAGPEIGVASTKAFTTQLAALMLLTIALGRRHGLTQAEEARMVRELRGLPSKIEHALALDDRIRDIAEGFADKRHALFLGRGSHYPIALEGALKLKEISYIHAEAYPAGELKHGPLALVDASMPVIAVAPNNQLLQKLKSNIQEVRARGGRLTVFADASAGIEADDGSEVLHVAPVDDCVSPIIYTVPLQLLAYHVALIKGTDVDKPRNLAKSVTVE